jgi:AcrR family transcriptional regulator
MDDVSKEMSISKKTLYTFFQNKSDLVDQAIRKKMQANENELKSIKKFQKMQLKKLLRCTQIS